MSKFNKYDIDKSFGLFRYFKTPCHPLIFYLALPFLALFKLTLHNDKHLIIKKIKFKDKDNNKINTYLFIPRNIIDQNNKPCLIYIHGGGFVYQGVLHQYKYCKKYAEELGCVVYFIDYTVIKKYPKSINDCISAYHYLINNLTDKYKIDKNNIGLIGDSAGGYLCLDLSYRLNIKFKYMALIYPFLDDDLNTDSMIYCDNTPMWNSTLTKKIIPYYFKNEYLINFNKLENFDFVSDNIYIETCQFDCLHDQDIIFANKIKNDTRNVILNNTLKTMHGYDIKISSPISKENVKKRIKIIKEFIAN